MTIEKPVFSSRHYKGLDGLRGLAFLSVFFHHYALTTHSTQHWILAVAWLAGGGWAGVDLFFVLSGFLITGILLDTREHQYYFRNFYARRALRIFPLFYGVMFLLLLLTPVLHLQWKLGHIAYFLYLGNIAGHVDGSLNFVQPFVNLTHTWSLAVEEQFYMLWPLVVLFVASRKRLLKVCAGLMGLGLLLRIALVLFKPGPGFEWAYGELPTHADGLLCGAIAAILVRQVDLAVLIRKSRWIGVAAGLGLIVLLVKNKDLNYHTAVMTIFVYPLLAVIFTVILLRTLKPDTWLFRICSMRGLRFFGRYSYGMYIYHRVFSPYLGTFLPDLQRISHSILIGGILYVLFVLLITVIVSVSSYELFEKRFLKLKSRFPYDVPSQRMQTV